MTQATQRPARRDDSRPPGPHPHYTLGTLVTLGVVGTVAALAVAISALMITANRNSVDDSLVSSKVDEILASTVGDVTGSDAGNVSESVIPDLTPKGQLEPAPAGEINVAVAPNMPPAADRTSQAIVDVTFEVVENVAVIDPANGVEFETWGYRLADGPDGVITGTPGPVIRARVGDVLRFTIVNPATNTHPHNIDLHAVTGQGGGAEATTVAPGETKTIEARLLYPGFFMYHCAYDDVPAHIAHGMHGGILVDPEAPLPPVDREWYIVQSEYYTMGPESGRRDLDRTALTDENPTHVVFNGATGALAGDNALAMSVGERARIFFVNAGLNLDSNFHPIGSHWDTVYQEAALLNRPLRGSQTTLVPAGGGTVVELEGQVPSTIILVDHALTRAFDKGAIGQIVVSGDDRPEIFEDTSGQIGNTGEVDGEVSAPSDEPAANTALAMVAGSGNPQPLDAPDEYAENETPADYSQNVITVNVGETVTWENQDAVLHTATAVDGTFDSGFLDQGESFSYTFTEVGEFEYFCLPHPWMRGKVIVEG